MVSKTQSIPAMEGYSALKGEILTRATSWMNLESTVLNEISGHKKTNTLRFHLDKILSQSHEYRT